MPTSSFRPEDVLAFWFPDDGHWESADGHRAFWETRMQGGMDQAICDRFADLTLAAARGELDHWAETPRGRLALLIALDQFPRSLWRDTPKAFSQDLKSSRLALEGIANGHYDALPHMWERQFYMIALSHCEGPDHLERMDMIMDMTAAHEQIEPDSLTGMTGFAVEQTERVRDVIARFGRHPHRNAVLGRISTQAEEAYIAEGKFPHEREIDADALEGRADGG